MTRAFHSISLGQLRAALAYHPLSLLLYGVTILHLLVACLRLLGWRSRLLRIPDPVSVMVWGTIGPVICLLGSARANYAAGAVGRSQ